MVFIIDIIVLVFGFLYWFLFYQIEIFWQYLVFFIGSYLIKLNCGVNDILNVINFINNLFYYWYHCYFSHLIQKNEEYMECDIDIYYLIFWWLCMVLVLYCLFFSKISMIFLIIILIISLLLFISYDQSIVYSQKYHLILIIKKIMECDTDILVNILYGAVIKKSISIIVLIF